MPELIEVELYRQAAEAIVGRRIVSIEADDAWYLKRGATAAAIADASVGAVVERARRIGKLLVLELDNGVALGLRFGMTGRLIVDGAAPISRLEYSSSRSEPSWDRFVLCFDGGGSLAISDPRRLGGVELEPDVSRLGPDAATITERQLTVALGSSAPLKAVLLNQAWVAGLGNLLVDEILWKALLDPRRPARSVLSDDHVGGSGEGSARTLAATIRSTVRRLTRRGGSHTGELMAHRHRDGSCPRCGARLERDTVGGRTTFWCGQEQH